MGVRLRHCTKLREFTKKMGKLSTHENQCKNAAWMENLPHLLNQWCVCVCEKATIKFSELAFNLISILLMHLPMKWQNQGSIKSINGGKPTHYQLRCMPWCQCGFYREAWVDEVKFMATINGTVKPLKINSKRQEPKKATMFIVLSLTKSLLPLYSHHHYHHSNGIKTFCQRN